VKWTQEVPVHNQYDPVPMLVLMALITVFVVIRGYYRQNKPGPQIQFHQRTCKVSRRHYAQPANPSLFLTDAQDHRYVALASANPDYLLPDGEVAIKSWAENEGMADLLIAAQVIGPVKYTLKSGEVEMTIHNLLIKP
jgi:hypothetical protein